MIYLDNAATSYPKPLETSEMINLSLQKYTGNPGRSGHKMSVASSKAVFRCRERTADFFGITEPENVIFTQNCTYSLNLAIKGYMQNKTGHIIISDLEHNSVLRPVHKLFLQKSATYDIAKVSLVNDDETVFNIKRLIKRDTKLIAVTHASNVCGKMLPIEKIGALAKEYDIAFLVDSAQTAGVVPIDMNQNHIDFLCAPGHKGLLGPFGTGILISNGKSLDTIIEGGNGTSSLLFETADTMPEKLESGTVNVLGICGLYGGIGYINKVGINSIYSHEMNLAQYAYERLARLENIILYTNKPQINEFVATICFNVAGKRSEEVAELLNKNGIAVRAGFHCSALAHRKLGTENIGAVRISIGSFNRKEDIDSLISALK